MWTSTLKKGLFLIGGLFLGGAVHAQYLRTSYFMEGASSRLQLIRVYNHREDILIFRFWGRSI